MLHILTLWDGGSRCLLVGVSFGTCKGTKWSVYLSVLLRCVQDALLVDGISTQLAHPRNRWCSIVRERQTIGGSHRARTGLHCSISVRFACTARGFYSANLRSVWTQFSNLFFEGTTTGKKPARTLYCINKVGVYIRFVRGVLQEGLLQRTILHCNTCWKWLVCNRKGFEPTSVVHKNRLGIYISNTTHKLRLEEPQVPPKHSKKS
jgi:hypothetical protein